MQTIKDLVKRHQFYTDLRIDTIENRANITRNMAQNYYHLIIEISNKYYYLKNRYFNKEKFILLVFQTIDPKVDDRHIKELMSLLTFEEKQSLEFHLNVFLYNLKTKKDVYAGLSYDLLASDMILENIVNQKEFLTKAAGFIDRKYLRDIKDVLVYDARRDKIEKAMQDLLWGPTLKDSEADDVLSLSGSHKASVKASDLASEKSYESKLTKKELLIKLKECEKKLKQ